MSTSSLKNQLNYFEVLTDDIYPLDGYRVPPLSETDQKRLLSWEQYFGIDGFKETWIRMDMFGNLTKVMGDKLFPEVDIGDLATEYKETLTDILTDPMTMFYAIQEAGSLDVQSREEIIIHTVGYESHQGMIQHQTLVSLLKSLLTYSNNA